MPSQKPRINLTVDHELNELLQDLAVLMKKPKSTIKYPRKHKFSLDSLEKKHKEIDELSREEIRKLNVIALRIGLNIK